MLISKTRAVAGADVLLGRTELSVALPEPAYVDVEVALSRLHTAESAAAVGAWQRAWAPALSALFVARRRFLSEAEAPWADAWRHRLDDVRVRAWSATPPPAWSLAVLSCRAQSEQAASCLRRRLIASQGTCC